MTTPHIPEHDIPDHHIPHPHHPTHSSYTRHDLAFALFVLRTTVITLVLLALAFAATKRAVKKYLNWFDRAAYEHLPAREGGSGGVAGRQGTGTATGTGTGTGTGGPLVVTLGIKEYRVTIILSLLALAAFTFFLDGTIFILRAIITRQWPSHHEPWRLFEYYIFGGLIGLAFTELLMAWEDKRMHKRKGVKGLWGTFYPKFIVGIVALGDIVGLGLLVGATKHEFSHHRKPIFTILHIVVLSVRILLLLIVFVLLLPPLRKTVYIPNTSTNFPSGPPDSNSPLLANSAGRTGENAPLTNGNGAGANGTGYGTFGDGGAGTETGPGGEGGNAAEQGVAGPNPPTNHTNGTTPSASSKPPSTSTSTQPIPSPQASSGLSTLIPRLKLLFPYLWPKKSVGLQAIAFSCLLLLAAGRVVNVMVPRTFGVIVEDLGNQKSPWGSLTLYIALRILQGNSGILNVIQSLLWIPVSQFSDREMSAMAFNHVINLSLAYHTRRKTGELLRTLDRGAAINNVFQTLLFNILPMFVDITVAVVYIAIKFDPLLAFVVFVIMVTYIGLSVQLTKDRVKYRKKMNEKDKYVRGIHSDTLMSWETVKYFTAEEYENERYLIALRDYQRAEAKVNSSLSILNLIQNFVITLGLLAGSMIVASRVVSGASKVGDFVVFITYLQQLYAPLNILGTLYRSLLQSLVDADQLIALLEEETDVKDSPNAISLPAAQGEIEFSDVSFSYDKKVPALRGVSFKVPPGSSVALVGESGSGKSTVLRLLFRFYDVEEGAIKLDGVDIRDVEQRALRQHIGVVPQDSILFNESIAYNIRYGRPSATHDEVLAAAKAAQIHDRVLTFPDQYETKVGERGVRMSGGERQRISIARTILKNPPVLLLDEATSALDSNTEREVQNALKNLSQGRTTVAIAHRLSTIVSSDLILVIRDGRVAESGTHSQLLEIKNGYYNELWNKQIRAELSTTPVARGPNGHAKTGVNGLRQGTIQGTSGTQTPQSAYDVPHGHP